MLSPQTKEVWTGCKACVCDVRGEGTTTALNTSDTTLGQLHNMPTPSQQTWTRVKGLCYQLYRVGDKLWKCWDSLTPFPAVMARTVKLLTLNTVSLLMTCTPSAHLCVVCQLTQGQLLILWLTQNEHKEEWKVYPKFASVQLSAHQLQPCT